MNLPIVSVVMVTYGHEKCIRNAIEGVLMQECDFEVELILSNDCSPDKTEDIIQDIKATHPKSSWIRYLKQDTNIGMMPNFIFAMQECKGKYVALCDGDDYWTEPLKLKKQIEFLEANPDYVLCFHQISILKPDGELVEDFLTKIPKDYETQETLAQLGNYIHTPSVVFRNLIKKFPSEFGISPIGDYFLYMILAEHGKLKYIEEVMAVYRYGVGVLSGKDNVLKSKKWIDCLVLIISWCKNDEIKRILYKRYQISIQGMYRLTLKEEKKSFFYIINKKIISFKNKIINTKLIF